MDTLRLAMRSFCHCTPSGYALLGLGAIMLLLTVGTQAAPLGCDAPARMQGRHCVCPRDYHCQGATCSTGTDASGNTISGFDVEVCWNCKCVSEGSAPSFSARELTKAAGSRTPMEQGGGGSPVMGLIKGGEAKGEMMPGLRQAEAVVPARSQAVVANELAASPRRPFAYLKFHKVGSTTVSVALERMAERQSLKLCGRDQDFIPSLPCKAWTTHDTEFVLIGGGVPALRFFVSHEAALITLFRDPMERLLSRYYYDRVLQGVKGSAPLTLEELDAWLEGPGSVESVHYVRVLSRGTLSFEEALRNLEEFDVVGLSEELDDFFVLLSAVLKVPPELLTYKNEKVVVGRPKVADMRESVQARLAEVTAQDRELYKKASELHRAQIQRVTDFHVRKAQFQRAQDAIDQRCTYSDTKSNVLTGKDCYNL